MCDNKKLFHTETSIQPIGTS